MALNTDVIFYNCICFYDTLINVFSILNFSRLILDSFRIVFFIDQFYNIYF